MKLIINAETTDISIDEIFDGYYSPDEYLDDLDDAQAIRDAIYLIEQYKEALIESCEDEDAY